jgi:hypothetical protein
MKKKYKKITFEEHLQIAKDLNDMRRQIQKLLHLCGEAAPQWYGFNKSLWKIYNNINNVRSYLEDNMYALWRNHPDMPEDMTKIYYPGDKEDSNDKLKG